MTTPIRIAAGPPTEPGWYMWRDEYKQIHITNPWRLCIVGRNIFGNLHVNFCTASGAISYTSELSKSLGVQWSTRIPDPVEDKT